MCHHPLRVAWKIVQTRSSLTLRHASFGHLLLGMSQLVLRRHAVTCQRHPSYDARLQSLFVDCHTKSSTSPKRKHWERKDAPEKQTAGFRTCFAIVTFGRVYKFARSRNANKRICKFSRATKNCDGQDPAADCCLSFQNTPTGSPTGRIAVTGAPDWIRFSSSRVLSLVFRWR